MRSLTTRMPGFGVALAAVMLSALPPPAGLGVRSMTLQVIHENQGTSFNGLGMQGVSLNGMGAQGRGLHGRGTQGGNPSGREAEAVDLGALALRAVRLPDGQVLPAARP
jgi:hypothetical protein